MSNSLVCSSSWHDDWTVWNLSVDGTWGHWRTYLHREGRCVFFWSKPVGVANEKDSLWRNAAHASKLEEKRGDSMKFGILMSRLQWWFTRIRNDFQFQIHVQNGMLHWSKIVGIKTQMHVHPLLKSLKDWKEEALLLLCTINVVIIASCFLFVAKWVGPHIHPYFSCKPFSYRPEPWKRRNWTPILILSRWLVLAEEWYDDWGQYLVFREDWVYLL